MSLVIRTVSPADIGDLLTIERVAFPGDRLSRRSFQYMARNPKAIFLVAERDEKPAGYILTLSHKRRTLGRIYSLAVAPEYVGKGIARALLQHCEDEARNRFLRGLQLEVRNDNQAAIKLYESSGYTEAGVVDDYYEDGMAALKFIKLFT